MVKQYGIVECRLAECVEAKNSVSVYINPDSEEKRTLIEQFKLDEHTLNSALDPNELSRIETEPNHVAIILKVPKSYKPEDGLEFTVTSIGMFLFDESLIIIMADYNEMFDNRQFSSVTRIVEIMLKVVNQSIQHFRSHLLVIDKVSEELADKISPSMENKALLQLFTLEKSLVYYLNGITSNGALMRRIKNHSARLRFTQEDGELLDDIIIENNQCFKQAEILSNILSSMMDARASIVNNNLNILMKRLNIITIGIMVPTLVVSAFSMNVSIPLQKHPMAFWIILTIAVVSMVGIFLFWRYKK
jgi:magnesium transporter